MKNLTLSIPSIHCEACTKIIKLSLSGVKGISETKVDLEKKILEAKIDEDLISIEEIITIIKEEAGHTAQ